MNRKVMMLRYAKEYNPGQKVKLKLTASEWEVVTDLLFEEGHYNIMEKLRDQLCGNRTEWLVRK